MSSVPTSIPVGSWVLVTGANGFLGSHVSLQFLKRGFKVRGTVRDPAQSTWLSEGPFKKYADKGDFQLVSVPDLGAEGAFDEAVKGVSAIIHVATITNIVPDPNEVITPLVASIRSIMNAANKEPSVKEFVLTSTGLTASPLTDGVDNGTITRDTWNDAALEAAWAPPPYGMEHAMANYPASKVAAEKEVWKVAKEENLHFNVNVVCPAGITGEPLNKKHIEGQAMWIVHAYRGNKMPMEMLGSSFFIDVKDVALVHVAAALDAEVKNERIQVWGHQARWEDVYSVLRKLRPQNKFIDDYPKRDHVKVSLDQTPAIELVKKWGGKDGYTSLEDSARENITTSFLED